MPRNLIHVDLFTDAYRVSCRTNIGMRSLYAVVGDLTTNYIELEDAYISRIDKPGEIVASYTTAAFRKTNINFLVLQDRKDGTPAGTGMLVPRLRSVKVFLTVPSFEIVGTVMYEGVMSPIHLLTREMTKFLFVYEAKASASLYPHIGYSGDLIVVDTTRIGVFCLEEIE